MTDVMQQNCRRCSFGLLIGNLQPFLTDVVNGLVHQVQCTQGMLKTGVGSSRIYQARQSELLDPSQTLQKRMFQQIKNKISRNFDKSVNRIVDDLVLVECQSMNIFIMNCLMAVKVEII
jgi:hypothetical protein